MESQPPAPVAGKLIITAPSGVERELEITHGQFTLGRGANSDIILQDDWVSRAHARLDVSAGAYTLTDLGSANGIIVNGVPVTETALKPGDVVMIGTTTVRLIPTISDPVPEVVALDTEAQVNATIVASAVPVSVNDTSLPRLAIRSISRTWELALDGDALSIGRQGDNDIFLDDPKVSRHHARVERRGSAFIIRDLDSANGFYAGAERITERVLKPGETIRIGGAEIIYKPGFTSSDLTIVEESRAAKEGRRPIVFVPGMMGSELWRGSEMVWPNPRLLFSDPEIFQLPNRYPLEPRGVVRQVVIVPNLIKQEQYSSVGDFFEQDLGYERGKNYLDFPYDWRQDVRESARLLAAAIDNWGVRQPITLIAHSLGTLVSRYYVERLGGKDKVGRLILMGGPHLGTPKSATSLVLGPNLLPFGLFGERLRHVLMTLPSTYQILPTYPCVVDQRGAALNLLEDESWAADDQRSLIRMAREFRSELGTRSSVSTLSIFGYGHKTVTRLNIHRHVDGMWNNVQLEVQPDGDATIPQHSAILSQTEIHPVHQNHGALFLDNDVKMRLKLELTGQILPA